MPLQIMNSAGLLSKNIVNSVGVFNGIVAMNSDFKKWTVNSNNQMNNGPYEYFCRNNHSCAQCQEYNSTQISKLNQNV